ncbi:bifunctional helix-turn-helix transcriptional regulator/GNAT family N-acetyltransferase [Halovenus salina]|uniref:GNAT family N-acetyltransferase n=1 Tax=Halovenus salina TaxID=1510225 RepID=A0ABD5W0D6_9EURY|nr:bifunctional helix-turn-helix transcriptional regulator/GNAT family N-acetyltransferase [Halovenus salina]
MTGIVTPEFAHDSRRDIYDYVERHGAMEPDAVREAMGMERRAFGHHVAILKRDSVLEQQKGKLRVAFEGGAEEEYTKGDVSFTIRQAREEDLTGLVGAIRQAIGGGQYARAETVADVVDNEGVLLRHNEVESRIFFVACVGGEVVGWVHLKHVDLDKLRHTAQLTVGVLEEYRGNSIGSHLLERGLSWAAKQEFEKIENALPATNERAIEFLKSRGFEVDAVREDHYKLNGDYVNEVMMMTQL